MTRFSEWCSQKNGAVTSHTLLLMDAEPSKQTHAVEVLANAVPSFYSSPERISDLLIKLGRPAVAKYVIEKLPTSPTIRSGDLGEILCTAYIAEETNFNLGIKRLRWKDHRNMSMRGDDVLAFSIGPKKTLQVLKAEVKSRATLQTSVVKEARNALSENGELPSAHAISFVADRVGEIGNQELQDALDNIQLKYGLKKSQVAHMLFTFSGNDPEKILGINLASYRGVVPQYYVGLRVSNHQDFIQLVFDSVGI